MLELKELESNALWLIVKHQPLDFQNMVCNSKTNVPADL